MSVVSKYLTPNPRPSLISPPSSEQFKNQPNLSAPSVFSLRCSLGTIAPDKIYNLVAQSHVDVSIEIPNYLIDVVAFGLLQVVAIGDLRPISLWSKHR
ncbi:hypothetical protein ACLB2K_030907 [Fragaria x ananassa]